MQPDDIVIENGSWTASDFQLMADWYGIDAAEFQEAAIDSGVLSDRYEDYVAYCWGDLEDLARDLGGAAKEPFDFIEASHLAGIARAQRDAARYLPSLDPISGSVYRVSNGALEDSEGNRYELALVAEGWEFFVCPELPDDRWVVEGELAFEGLTPEQKSVAESRSGEALDALVSQLVSEGRPPALRIIGNDQAVAEEFRACLEDVAALDLRPEFISPFARGRVQDLLATDAYLMHRHDANLPDSRDVESSLAPRVTTHRSPSENELRGYPMTSLLEEAFRASEDLGAEPTPAALARYERAMSEIDRREAHAPAPSKDVTDYLSKALSAYRDMSGWQGLSATEALESFVADLASGRIPAAEPTHDALELATPIGTLVASSAMSYEDSHVIEVSLEKPDGTSGQVAMVEVVSGDLADGYATPLHTFCWDGNEESPGTVVDCDHEGEYMQYVGYEHGAPSGGDAVRKLLDAEALDDPVRAPTPSPDVLASRAKAAAESGPQIASHSDVHGHAL